jgi:hypothetical protein
MSIIDCVQLELYTNKFGGTKLKRNYIWRYANKTDWIPRRNESIKQSHCWNSPISICLLISQTVSPFQIIYSAYIFTMLVLANSHKTLHRSVISSLLLLSLLDRNDSLRIMLFNFFQLSAEPERLSRWCTTLVVGFVKLVNCPRFQITRKHKVWDTEFVSCDWS